MLLCWCISFVRTQRATNNSQFNDVHTSYTLRAYHTQFGGGALAIPLNTLSSDWLGKKSNICLRLSSSKFYVCLFVRSVLHVTEIEQSKFRKTVRFFHEFVRPSGHERKKINIQTHIHTQCE